MTNMVFKINNIFQDGGGKTVKSKLFTDLKKVVHINQWVKN